jgi:hypothetical protein
LSKNNVLTTAYINGSSRTQGHTALIAEKMAESLPGKIIHLEEYNIGYFDYNNSNREDDFINLIEDLAEIKLWILFTPVYWYSMSGQMKTFLDRFSDLLKWNKPLAESLKNIRWYIISCGSDDEEIDGFFNPFKLSADYLGINYLGQTHLWKDNRQELCTEVENRMNNSISLLSKR